MPQSYVYLIYHTNICFKYKKWKLFQKVRVRPFETASIFYKYTEGALIYRAITNFFTTARLPSASIRTKYVPTGKPSRLIRKGATGADSIFC